MTANFDNFIGANRLTLFLLPRCSAASAPSPPRAARAAWRAIRPWKLLYDFPCNLLCPWLLM